jgi:hypothetical protein
MVRTSTKLSDEIRQAVETCGQTRYAISKATGIDQATLSRFVLGQRGLPMKTLDQLADYLDLHITTRKKRQRKGK